MADLKYSFLDNDFFGVYQNTETPKVELNFPLFESPIDISDWSSRVTETGVPIVKSNDESKLVVNNSPEQELEIEDSTKDSKETTYKPNNSKFTSKNEWVTQLSNAYRKLGISENGIRNLIAKNALESGWGRSAQGNYNYGNITTGSSWKGSYVNGRDHDAKGNSIRQKFRSYNSIEEFAKDEVDFLRRLYDFDDKDDIKTFVKKLQGGNKGKRRYAESPTYENKVINVYAKL